MNAWHVPHAGTLFPIGDAHRDYERGDFSFLPLQRGAGYSSLSKLNP